MNYTRLALLGLTTWMAASGCGRKKDMDRGDELAPAVLGGGGAGQVRSGAQTTMSSGTAAVPRRTRIERRAKPLPNYDIVPVTQIVAATSGVAGWGAPELPFTGAPVALNTAVADGQTPFSFTYDYPGNNYQFTDASLVIDTSRDTSDTEGIFVDGVFSGRPPTNMVNLTSPKITDLVYFGSGAATVNTYYIDFALSHYKRLTRNTFTLSVADLLKPTTKTAVDALKDGELDVVAGDDSPVYQAYLVLRGLTIASDALSCVQSDTYSFTNAYLHNDGNTVGQAAFAGTAGTPYTSFASPGTYPSHEMSYDAPLPKVETANITIASAKLAVKAKKTVGGAAAIVVNGIGVAEPGFDRATATSAVESWNEDAVAPFQTFLAGVTTNVAGANAEIDLIALFGAAKVRDLLAQGKLNVAVAGNLYLYGQAATSTRGFGTAVAGPELNLTGTYFTQVCQVPNNPGSPLTENGFVAPEPEYEDVEVVVDEGTTGSEGEVTVLNDGVGPNIGSVQVLDVTSTGATIVWMTDEAASSQVSYGIGGPSASTPLDATLTTFHQVKLTGLSPYKYYSFQVLSTDKYGNASASQIDVFTTLR